MRALVIRRYGGPAVMSVEDRPEPLVGPSDVLIAVRAASLNPVDYKLRQGQVRPVLDLPFPIALGCDVSGVVQQTGDRVTRVKVGDEVYARLEKDRMGGLAERVAADEQVVAVRPPALSFEEAASLPLAALTALQALREVAGLQPGQRVLVHAGAGGVGSLAIRIARRLGGRVATTTSGRNADFVRELGAEEVVDYTREKIGDRLRDLDVVLDTLGGRSELTSLGLCRPGGIVVGVSGLPDDSFAARQMPWWIRPVIAVATVPRKLAALRARARFAYWFMRPDGAQLAELGTWVAEGSLRPVLHRTYPFAQVEEAFAELERGRARGKIVVSMG